MSKIPHYYNNFKKDDEGEPEDMVSWKAWLAASAAAWDMAGHVEPPLGSVQVATDSVAPTGVVVATSPALVS